MARSTRFSAALHILAVLSVKSGVYVSSELIAKSVGTNSVVVRRLLAMLQQAGFVATQAGVQGGARLNIDPAMITLLDVYDAVEEESVFRVHDPAPECPVACTVKADVNRLLEKAEEKMKLELKKTRLSRITQSAVEEYQRTRE